jgi:hypothetical protein
MWTSDDIIPMVVLQDLTDLEKVRGPYSEVCSVSSHDAHQAISTKVERSSDAEDEEDPAPITLPGINLEPEVSCIFVSVLGGFHKYGYRSFYNFLMLQ